MVKKQIKNKLFPQIHKHSKLIRLKALYQTIHKLKYNKTQKTIEKISNKKKQKKINLKK